MAAWLGDLKAVNCLRQRHPCDLGCEGQLFVRGVAELQRPLLSRGQTKAWHA
jgi:hypothetical protein